jgi:hypothetical protein
MHTRASDFWQRISDGIAVQELWSQFSSEARASYRLYSREVDWTRSPTEKGRQRLQRVISGFFWAMVVKLSPARRVLFVVALVLLVLPGFDFRYQGGEFQMPNLSFFGAVAFLILLSLELADRVTMKRDLEIAKEIQTWLMPAAPPQVRGVDMAFATRPANTVAGDYYDAFLRDTPTSSAHSCPALLLIVADVAGKSVPAALLMATLQASFRTLARLCTSKVELIERLNRYCCEQNVGGQRFTTAFLAEFDPASRQLDPALRITLFEATGINNKGQIVAEAYGPGFSSGFGEHAFLLTPLSTSVPEPNTLALSAVALIACASLRTRRH